MDFLFPFLAAFLQAGSFTLDKIALSIRRVDYKKYVGVSFPLIFIITGIIFAIFQPPLHLGLFAGKFLYLVILSIFLTIVTNLIFYRALDADCLSEIESISLLQNISVILLAGFLFAGERNIVILFAALAATVAVIWSHWHNGHFCAKKKTMLFLVWTVAIAPFGAIIIKEILSVWNPIFFEFVRSGAVALIIGPMFYKNAKRIPLKAFWVLLATNILTSISWILYYFSYQISGIVYTVLLFSLQPFLVYFSGVFFLKEKFYWKKFVAFMVIIAAIIAAQLAR